MSLDKSEIFVTLVMAKINNVLCILPLYLKHGSPADTFYNNLSREVQKNYELLKTELIERFPVIPGTRVAGLIQYNTRKLQPGESIDQYIDHMQKIGTSLKLTPPTWLN